MITLVLGGARSGKSEVAERLATRLGPEVTYLATAVLDPADADFARRVEAHRARRPPTWTTVETGPHLPAALAAHDGPALVDSLGTWVAAVSAPPVAGTAEPVGRPGAISDPDPDPDALAGRLRRALEGRSGDTVVVSEEVGLGVHPATEAGRSFRDLLGVVNRAVADAAEEVMLVVAGRVIPLPRLPEGP